MSPDEKKWVELPPDFITGIGICKMANNKSTLSGVFISGNVILSTDGWQINRFSYASATKPLPFNFWISDPAAAELLKIGQFTHCQLKGFWVHFKNVEGVVFSVKTLQADKWPVERIQQSLKSHQKQGGDFAATFPKELFNAIDRATSFYIDISDYKAVKLVIEKKGIRVSAERASGKFVESVAWEPGTVLPDFEPIALFVDSNMMLFGARRAMAFYLHEGVSSRNSTKGARLVFIGDNSMHIMSTLAPKDDTEKAEEEKKVTAKPKAPKAIPSDEDDEPPAKKGKGAKKKEPASVDKRGRPSVNPPDEDEEEEEDEPIRKGKDSHIPDLYKDEEDEDEESGEDEDDDEEDDEE
jgi:signal recognition particle receptor subunit beta